VFLLSLHDDVLQTEMLSERLRQRRVNMRDLMLTAADVLFRRKQRDALTDDECNALVWSSAFNITAPGLPSVDELVGTGRMGIIRDAELRSALVALRQTRVALGATISEKSASSNFIFLPRTFPELFQLNVQFDDALGEVQTSNVCNLAAMRSNRSFLNQFSANADGYDAYVRDGVKPWSQQLDRVHALVDSALSLDHRGDTGR